TVEDSDLHGQQRITRQTAILHLLLNTFVYRRNVFLRYRTTHDFVHELVLGVGRQRLDTQPDVTVLTTTTALFDVLAFHFHRLADGFAVGYLRLADIGIHAEL